MITTHCFGKWVPAVIGAVMAVAPLALVQPVCAQNEAVPAPERIGVYDSRAVAVAYAGSAAQVKKMQELTARLKKAREAGDTNATYRLETEGRAWQSKLKHQGFGTASVDDLLAEIAGDLPAIQQTAGVTSLISKWNKAELDRHRHAQRVDVTMPLVDAFQPNATQRKHAIAIQGTKPVRIKE